MQLGLRSARDRLADQEQIKGVQWCARYAELADKCLQAVMSRIPSELGLPIEMDSLALVSVGGYGRAMLAPGSDLDLMLVHDGAANIPTIAQAIWYPIWDDGLRLDHSVRTLKEAFAVAQTDLRALLGMLHARTVAGNDTFAQQLIQGAQSAWLARQRTWLPALEALSAERVKRHGEIAFMLEPEIKEGHGGLRDIEITSALALLPAAGLDSDSRALLGDGESILTTVRVELQRRHRKPMDRLLLQDQDRVAEAAGYKDADELMAAVADAGRSIAWIADDIHRRAATALSPRPSSRAQAISVGPGLVAVGGEIAIESSARPSADPSLALRAAETSARLGIPLARDSLQRLGAETLPPPIPWPREVLNALVALLGTGRAAIAAMEALDHVGLSLLYMPPWANIRNRPQRNAYHRFTVDRHLLETAANAAEAVRNVSRPDLLLVVALLHDIGKGGPRDHTEAGIDIVADLAPKMGFTKPDVEILVTLVKYHLLLADAATRRDLDDPVTIDLVAQAVKDRETLFLLAALTEADSIATGPSAWSPWKEGLVNQLVSKVERRLTGEIFQTSTPRLSEEQQRLVDIGKVALIVEGTQLSVVAPDRKGLLAAVAGTLALHGLDVRSAIAVSGYGKHRSALDVPMAVEQLEVHARFGQTPKWDAVERDLVAALEGKLSLDQRLAARSRLYAAERSPRAAVPAQPRVLIHENASTSATVLEVRAADGVGVLHLIAAALAECNLNVTSARVSTLGHEVVDSFYVTDLQNAKISDTQVLSQTTSAILRSLRQADEFN